MPDRTLPPLYPEALEWVKARKGFTRTWFQRSMHVGFVTRDRLLHALIDEGVIKVASNDSDYFLSAEDFGLWSPCRLGHPDPENCPDCTPSPEERCPEVREVLVGSASNNPNDPLWVRTLPCRVLGTHERHNDGQGTTWVYPRICGAECPHGGGDLWPGHCNRPVRVRGERCWQHREAA